MEIKSQFDPVLRKIIKNKPQTAIIPVGSLEQHGSHLPISTDSDIVSHIALKLSERRNFILLPTITYGVSFEHAPLTNISIKPSTLEKILIDLCLSLSANNIKTVFIINGHFGNLKPLKRLERKIAISSKNSTKVFQFSYWQSLEREFDHAGFVETSLMLAISKTVKMSSAKRGLVTTKMKKQKIKELKKVASVSFLKVTKNGIWGDPRGATKEDGLTFLEEIVTNLEKKCQTCLTDDRSKLHQ
jgi:creatinine amidohydrolase